MDLLVSNYETRDIGAYFIAPIALEKSQTYRYCRS